MACLTGAKPQMIAKRQTDNAIQNGFDTALKTKYTDYVVGYTFAKLYTSKPSEFSCK